MEIHPRLFYSTVILGTVAIASMYGYVWYDGYTKEQYLKQVNAEFDKNSNATISIQNGVITVSSASQ